MDARTELASGFTVARYTVLRPILTGDAPSPDAWSELLDAVLALDCLLIDTIQSFREGRVTTGEVSPAHSFKTFLASRHSGSDRGHVADRD
ncbi:MAG TPA: hypothetical protein VF767_08125 [Bryobacteraceae bacterium]